MILADVTLATSLSATRTLATRPAELASRTPFPKGNTHVRVCRQADRFSMVPDQSKFSVLINKEKTWRSGDKGGAVVTPACLVSSPVRPAEFPPYSIVARD